MILNLCSNLLEFTILFRLRGMARVEVLTSELSWGEVLALNPKP